MIFVQIRIEGHDLPGRHSARGGNYRGYHNVHVGVQRRGRPGELLDLQPGDAATVQWSFDALVDGADVHGPYIQGRPGERFIYLSWGHVDPDGGFTMFRRAKLMLADVDPDVLAKASESGTLSARLGLTDPQGEPACARVHPPAIEWFWAK